MSKGGGAAVVVVVVVVVVQQRFSFGRAHLLCHRSENTNDRLALPSLELVRDRSKPLHATAPVLELRVWPRIIRLPAGTIRVVQIVVNLCAPLLKELQMENKMLMCCCVIVWTNRRQRN